MPEFKFLNYTVADALATITINRPPHNVLDIATMEELNRALDIAAREESAKLLMITAAGEKVFSAGVDVMDHTPDKVVQMIDVFHGILKRLMVYPLPTVAALNGSAMGGGCELALACDMAVATEDTRIGQPEIKLGVFPPIAAILMPRIMPLPKVMELLLGGGLITATNVATELDAVANMTVGELAENYREVFGEPTRSRNKVYLQKKLCWRIQELAEGGLSPRAVERIEELAVFAPARWRPLIGKPRPEPSTLVPSTR